VWDRASRVRLTLAVELARRANDRSPVKTTTENGQTRYSLDLAAVDLNAFKNAYGARVRVEMEDGRSFEMEQESPTGSGARPFDDRRKAVEDKFRRETRYTLRKERMEKAIDLIHHMDDAGSSQLRELVRLCCSEKV
jgi:2-methylcitrate dehydratase PrpD